MEETKLILGYIVACDNSRIATAVMTLLLTGLRRGELLGLKWEDIDEYTHPGAAAMRKAVAGFRNDLIAGK